MKRSEDQKPGVTTIDAGRRTVFIASAGTGNDHAHEMLEAIVEMRVAMARHQLRREGLDGVPEVEPILARLAGEFRHEFERERRREGVAPHIRQLLGAVSKREAERLAGKMVITAMEFADFAFNAHVLLGYRHRMKWRQFVPEHLEGATGEASSAVREATPGPASPALAKAMSRVHAVFEQRKRVHVHMFERGAKWHAFFFDLNDVGDPEQGPGPHIHYVSHRWGLDRHLVWDNFDQRRQTIPRGAHIRYSDPRTSSDPARRRSGTKWPSGAGHVLANDESGFWYLPGE